MDEDTIRESIEEIVKKYCDSTWDGTLDRAVFVGNPKQLAEEIVNYVYDSLWKDKK
jgi:hypothetical protein